MIDRVSDISNQASVTFADQLFPEMEDQNHLLIMSDITVSDLTSTAVHKDISPEALHLTNNICYSSIDRFINTRWDTKRS